MKKYKEELCFLGTCKKNQRQNFIRQASSEIINALGDAKDIVHRKFTNLDLL